MNKTYSEDTGISMDLTLEEPIYDAVAEDDVAFFSKNNHLNGVGKCNTDS